MPPEFIHLYNEFIVVFQTGELNSKVCVDDPLPSLQTLSPDPLPSLLTTCNFE